MLWMEHNEINGDALAAGAGGYLLFPQGQLFFGSVSHEGFCAALPDTQDFEKMLWNIGMWPKEEDPLVRIELPDYREEREP